MPDSTSDARRAERMSVGAPERLTELRESGAAAERVSHDQQRPLLADDVQGAHHLASRFWCLEGAVLTHPGYVETG